MVSQHHGTISNITLAGELDAILARIDGNCVKQRQELVLEKTLRSTNLEHTGFRHSHEVCHDALELSRWHRNGGCVLGVRNTQMLLVDVHKLQLVFRRPLGVFVLVDEVENIGRIFGLESEQILVSRRAQHLGEGGQVDTERDIAVATEKVEHG